MLQITFGDERYLLVLLVIPIVMWMARRSLSDLTTGRMRTAIAVRCLVVTLLVLALAETKHFEVDENFNLAVIADRSLSVPNRFEKNELDFAVGVAKEMDPVTDKGQLIVFGEEALIETRLGPQTDIIRITSVLDRDFTNLDKAIRLAVASFPRGPKRRIVVISDGNENIGDAVEAAKHAYSRGVRVDVLPVGFRQSGDALVDKIILPPKLRTGEPFPIRTVVETETERRVEVVLRQGELTIGRADTLLTPGRHLIEFEHTAEVRGFQRFEAEIRTEDNDPITPNNRAFTYKTVEGKSSVLYVYADTYGRGHLADALYDAEIVVDEFGADYFPLHAAELAHYDSIILDNVPADALDDGQMAAVEYAVAEYGVGLIMVGGDQSFAAGGWQNTDVEKALPVDCELREERVIPRGALAMIMHTCEFQDGNTWMKKIAEAALKVLSRKDYVGLLYYSHMTGDQWGIRMQLAEDKPALIADIRDLDPGDMPEFDPTLELAIKGLKPLTGAAVKHILIISDGDPPTPNPALIQECKLEKISISTVCINPHGGPGGSEVRMMKSLANQTGGKFYFVKNPAMLPQIFTKEAKRVQSKLIVEGDLPVQIFSQTEPLRGIPLYPNLYGYVMTEAKDAAEVALTIGPDEDVLLAHWRYGAGKAAAFTSDATASWAQGWLGRADGMYNQFWAQLVRWVAKEITDSPLQVTTRMTGRTAQIVVDAVEGGEFRDDLDLGARVLTPNGEKKELRFVQTAPGRYEATLDSDEIGSHELSVVGTSHDGEELKAFTGVVFSYSDEYRVLEGALPASGDRPASQGWTTLMQIKEAGGGDVLTWEEFDKALKRDDLEAGRSYNDLWPFLLACALILVPIDVGVRRIAIDWVLVRARIAAWFAGFRGREKAAAAAKTLSALRSKRTEVQSETKKKFEARRPTSGRAKLIPGFRGRAARPGEISEAERKLADRKQAKAPKPPAEGAFTSRLLEAKRRARRNMEKDEEAR